MKLLKDFILTKQNNRNGIDSENNIGVRSIESNENNDDNIIPLQQHLINQTTDPNVTKIRGAPCKKKIEKCHGDIKKKKSNM